MKKLTALLLAGLLLLTACSAQIDPVPPSDPLELVDTMPLSYAKQFSVGYTAAGDALVTIGEDQQVLVVKEGNPTPEALPSDLIVLQQPVDNIYLAASSAMDLFREAGALDAVTMTSTTRSNWSLPAIQQALADESILYVGKYSAPDYELLLEEGCRLSIQSTMIYHSPEVKEQLEQLGIPVLVERSSYEPHPLGRMEWVKLYGLLTGHEAEAVADFDQRAAGLSEVLTEEPTGKTVAFFYISTGGYANIRKPGDYISKMIELAGGTYLFSELAGVEENALSTMNLQLEQFYAAAHDADVLIYNSTVDGELEELAQLLEKCPLLADSRAVQTGQVWCTGQNMFQQTSGACEMVAELHELLTGTAEDELTFLHRLR